jgi:hypothetical protein
LEGLHYDGALPGYCPLFSLDHWWEVLSLELAEFQCENLCGVHLLVQKFDDPT